MTQPLKSLERAKAKSRLEDERIVQDKRSAVLGFGREMITSLFLLFGLAGCWPAKPNSKKRGGGGFVAFTQGGGLGGLALGYSYAAPLGLPPSRCYGEANRKPDEWQAPRRN